MSAVTDYMKGFCPQQPEVAINSMMTCLLIDPKAATVLASVMLATYFGNGVRMLLDTTPMAVDTPENRRPTGSSQLGVEEHAVPAPGAKEAPTPNSNLPRP